MDIERIKRSPLYSVDKKIVIGRGKKPADFLFIGEASGKTENRIGKPFVGRSGELLNWWIQEAGISSFYISNAVPLMPVDAMGQIRKPTLEEIEYFKFFVDEIFEEVKPRFVVAIGDTACLSLFGKPIRECLGKVLKVKGARAIAVYHPAYFLRRGTEEEGKRKFLEAFELLKSETSQEYFPLHLHTDFSVGDAVASVSEYVKVFTVMGFRGGGICEHGNLSSTWQWQKKLREVDKKPLFGVEMYVFDGESYDDLRPKSKDKNERRIYRHLCLYAKNEVGWKNLLKLNWLSVVKGFYYKPRVLLKDVFENSKGLIATSACTSGFLIYYLMRNQVEEAFRYAEMFKKVFGSDFYIEIMPHYEIKEYCAVVPALIKMADSLDVKMVVSLDAHYVHKDEKDLHRCLLAIDRKKKFKDEPGYTGNTYFLMSSEELRENLNKVCSELNVDELFRNSFEIADKCNLVLKPFEPEEILPSFGGEKKLIEIFNDRFERMEIRKGKEYVKRAKIEIDRICRKKFADYFLLVDRILDEARKMDIRIGVGRGSVGGSLVGYVMGFHIADPIKYDLIFDRFISEARKDLPDIDLDFQDTKREQLIARLVEIFGNENVCKIVTFSQLLGRSAVRDVGRILDVDRKEYEQLASKIYRDMNLEWEFRDGRLKFYIRSFPKKLVSFVLGCQGIKRHRGEHAAGVVLTKKPLFEYIPVLRVRNNIVSAWDKDDLAEMGLIKIDILGLKVLDIIDKVVKMTGAKLPKDFNDKNVYENIIKQGNTYGVFMLETEGMRNFVKNLKPDNFFELIDANALFRPGPLRSGLADKYVARKFGKERIRYFCDAMKKLTEATRGIIIYQETVMRIMHDIGGFSWEEAEKVRKVVAKSKGEQEIEKLRGKFIKGALERGIDKIQADKVFDDLKRFGAYGFNRSHSCLYAILAYYMAWLKYYYPLEFYKVILDRETDVTMKEKYLAEAVKLGVKVVRPHINKSKEGWTLDKEKKELIAGFSSIKGLGEKYVAKLVEGQPYKSIDDVVKVVNKAVVRCLIKAGAIDEFIPSRKWALENIDSLMKGLTMFEMSNEKEKEFFDAEKRRIEREILEGFGLVLK